MIPKLEPSIVVDGVQIRDWTSYSIRTSIVDGIDQFEMERPFDRDAWELCRPDRPVQVLVGGVPVLTGYIDDSERPEGEWTIQITGRNKVGRLQQDCASAIHFRGLGMLELIEKLASPFFSTVTFENARNRRGIRGRGAKARAKSVAGPVALRSRLGTTIEPGQTRLEVISQLCEQAGYLVWSSGDGKELIVGRPNYDQEPQFRFFMPAPSSRRVAESTVLSMGIRRSTGDCYSRIIVVGSGQGTDVNYGPKVASRYAQAKNNPATPDGDGLDFSAPKRLILQRAVNSVAEAQEFADAEMSRRNAQGNMITVRAAGHGQLIGGTELTIFGNDLLASVEDEGTGVQGVYSIIECTYTSGRGSGEETVMSLVRKGAVLSR